MSYDSNEPKQERSYPTVRTEEFERHWPEIRNRLKDHWNKLTDGDIDQVNGQLDILLGMLRQKYGAGQHELEQELNGILADVTARDSRS